MTLTEAIRLKQLEGDAFLDADPDDLEEAEQLSIEAIKRLISLSPYNRLMIGGLLPGETLE